ncbi:MarR family transcriptional regulator [Conexibacter sp. W3-3-2]|uniref:MarR family winged helix-turn-helix transcriptional regulator n=1 Tax=Conexibacter sp. W3-3-2 TaxID=2675227 RepID=UPI0012B6F963|nr:MarR family transcriptional regulator [Conexibacter sp. W3-3-2]MTD43813.1 MarR family transcriptional regulator [Conexibacter sp. W3-3-2]
MQTKATRHDTIELLLRRIYGIGMVQRELARQASQELGSNGFTTLAIVHTHGPLRIGDIAQRLGVDVSVASRQVTALVKVGYLERQADEADGRAQLIATTDAGTTVLRDCHQRMVREFEGVLDDWTEPEIEALTAGLERLREDFTR